MSGLDDLPDDVYARLRAIAGRVLDRRANDAVLQPTLLVHDAWLQLADAERVDWRDATRFYAVAARAVRDVLVDHRRRAGAAKRGGDRQRVTVTGLTDERAAIDLDVLALHDALERFAALDPRAARIVELRYFAGLTGQAIADELRLSRQTVVRELTAAHAWLARELDAGEA